MTITLELSLEQEACLEAQAQGKPLETYLQDTLEELAKPTLTDKQKAAIALLDAWRAEDATEDESELERRDSELEEFKFNMNLNRAAEGRSPVYP